ncbi:MAG: hypothetical protein M3150_06050 [Pseudomonadota bacterium]|nr:hypothetical protein [Pseudomonadota bacterium]
MSALQRIAGFGLVCVLCAPAWAASKAGAEAQQRYHRERALCLNGQSNQDRATCLREAGAALQEARRNRLDTRAGADFKANASARCNAQPAADREACVQRVTGAGSTQGSVAGGGLIREVETPVK